MMTPYAVLLAARVRITEDHEWSLPAYFFLERAERHLGMRAVSIESTTDSLYSSIDAEVTTCAS